MRCEWSEVELGQLCEITSSKRIFAREYKTRGIPFYRGKEIIEKQKGNTISTELFIDESRYEEIKMKFGCPEPGDILLSSVGTLGVPYVVKNEKFYFKDGNLTWIRNFINVDSGFLYYWILSPEGKHQIDTKCIGSTQKALTIETLLRFKILLPPYHEQKGIAAILSALDAKIELNNRINKNLEAQVQAIFKSWFVDFEPFRDGEFVDSELGPIPKGWRVGILGDISNYVTEKLPKEQIHVDNYISTENMLAGKQGVTAASSLPNTPTISKYDINDILVSNIRPYFKKIWFATQSGGCSNDILVFRGKSKNLNGLLYCLLYSDVFFDYATTTSKGTKMPRGDKNAIMKYKIALPIVLNEDLYIQKLSSIVDGFQVKISELQTENRTLSTTRDTLLPKLITGEIRVPLEV